MKRIKITSIFLICLFSFSFINAQFGQDLSQAEQFFNQKKYEKSIEIYNSIIKQGKISSALYFNLGNSYYKNGDFSNAELYFEKALKLDYGNDNIKSNLRLTLKKIDSDISESKKIFIFQWWDKFISVFKITCWFYLTLILFFFILIYLIYYLFYKNQFNVKYPKRVLILLIIITLISEIGFIGSYNQNIQKQYILMGDEALFSGPDERSDKLYDLKSGEKLKLTDSLQNWYFIELINGEKGWILKDKLKANLGFVKK